MLDPLVVAQASTSSAGVGTADVGSVGVGSVGVGSAGHSGHSSGDTVQVHGWSWDPSATHAGGDPITVEFYLNGVMVRLFLLQPLILLWIKRLVMTTGHKEKITE